jgi:hypothetical protein
MLKYRCKYFSTFTLIKPTLLEGEPLKGDREKKEKTEGT